MSEQTPMMQQYWSIKEQHKDAILFFRLGDFYEMFFEDAHQASKLLDLTLTSRNKNQEDSVPLCGIPVHSAQSYINRLIQFGHKVAICEQVEDPKKAKGIVKREVVQIFSPGLVLDPECLETKSPNYLASIVFDGERWGLAMADISTGDFRLTEVDDEKKLIQETLRHDPRELVIDDRKRNEAWAVNLISNLRQVRFEFLPGWHFDVDFGHDLYQRYYQIEPYGLGIDDYPAAKLAGSALLSYLSENKLLKDKLLGRPLVTYFHDTMVLDENTKHNLELLKNTADGNRQGSLFWLLDRAETSMGSRKIKEWLLYPLLQFPQIEERQEAVEEGIGHVSFKDSLKSLLSQVGDLERLQSRILAELANARDLVALKNSLKPIALIKECLKPCRASRFKTLAHEMDPLFDVQELIENTVCEEPPFALREGGLIKANVNALLDELRDIERNGKSVISAMEAKERQATGIGSLKIRYNRVFGYYLEITHTHREKIPSHYVRKQTLSNAERYITPELKEYEEKVLGAADKSRELEYELFCDLREKIFPAADRIKKTAQKIAELDALLSFATVAAENNYCRPKMVDEPVIDIKKGRHPVVELLHREEAFVPNDVLLDGVENRLLMITGPNMAGKSTVMRQTALTLLMAQMGSFVPAASATLGVVDRIFTRIGASDHLQKGESTFMVEMLETAHILSHATKKSLILLDEIGRGTSTFDGLSIAWAVAESIHDRIGARTLFATHYHELTDLAEEKKGIQNYHVAVKEWDGKIVFLRQLKKGGTNRSYGVSVAAMAGLPKETIDRAREILKLLEEKDLAFQVEATHQTQQPSLFEAKKDPMIEELKNLDLNAITPMDALNFLAKIKKNYASSNH